MALIYEVIIEVVPTLTNDLMAKYNLTRYVLIYIIRNILEKDCLFQKITTHPEHFVRDASSREHFKNCIRLIVKDVVIDVNAEVEDIGPDFDYRIN